MIPVFKYLCGVCVGREEGEHNVYCTKFMPIVPYSGNPIMNNIYR